MRKPVRCDPSELMTIGAVAEALGVPTARVHYVLATRHHIVPVGRVGHIRVYSPATVPLVRIELDAQADRGRGRPLKKVAGAA